MRNRGFTLIEMVLAGLIMIVVAGFGLFSLGQGHKSTESRGMAEEIAEELKAARQEAISSQTPVAVVFPSGNRTTGRSQSIYQLEGMSQPRVTRSIKYSETYPDSCFFWGAWGGATPESTTVTAAETDFDIATWGTLPQPNDYVLVFTPSGTVKSNGLPVFGGGEYRLLVSNGVMETAGSPFFSPVSVSKPYTVRVGKAGAVSCQPGVYGATIPDVPATIAISGAANSAPPPTAPSGGPVLLEVRPEPKPVLESDGGAVTIVPQEGYITLIAEAQDPSGGPLTVQWSAEGPKGPGKFSAPGNTMSMGWDPKFRLPGELIDPDDPEAGSEPGELSPRWVARMNWTPPENAEAGELYDLTCTVRNPRGGVHTLQMGAEASVEVVKPDKVACVNTDASWERYYIAWLNPEGSNVISVTVPDLLWDQLTPVWSPNGTKLAFYQGKYRPSGVYEAELYVVNDDGTGSRRLFTCRGDFADYNFGPSFSPNGAQVAFSTYEGDEYRSSRVYRADIFGEPDAEVPITNETAPAGEYSDHTDVSWNPVYQDYIMYTGTRYDSSTDDNRGSSIRVCDLTTTSGPNSRDLVSESGTDWANTIGESHWSFDGRKVVYTQGGRLYWFRFDPTTGTRSSAPEEITPPIPGFRSAMPRFSPDDNQVAVINYSDDDDYGSLYVIESLTASPTPWRRVSGGFGGIWGYNWSADGTEFVFSVMDNENLYTVRASGGGTPKDVTPPGFNIMSTPSWWAP